MEQKKVESPDVPKEQIFIDGDFNNSYESKVKNATGKNTIISKKELAELRRLVDAYKSEVEGHELVAAELRAELEKYKHAAAVLGEDSMHLTRKNKELEAERDKDKAEYKRLDDKLFQMSQDLVNVSKERNDLQAERDKLKEENENLCSVMIAAAEEIQEHWQAHCDEEGYGPQNLMYRLEHCIPSDYPGYKFGSFTKLEADNERLKEGLKELWNKLHGGNKDYPNFDEWLKSYLENK